MATNTKTDAKFNGPDLNLDIRQRVDPRRQASFSLANRLRRLTWGVVYVLLFRPSPRPCHRWRAFLLRGFGANLGRDCHVYPKVKIWAPWNLMLDDQAGIADDVICYSMAPIILGKRVIVSQGAHLCTGTHDYESAEVQALADFAFDKGLCLIDWPNAQMYKPDTEQFFQYFDPPPADDILLEAPL